MIDTSKLRKLDADDNLGLSIPMSHEAITAIADELDELREHKRRTTPLTREEIEAELVRRGFVVAHNLPCETVYRKSGFFDSVRLFSDGAIRCIGDSESFQLRAVTIQLLDAVLEAK